MHSVFAKKIKGENIMSVFKKILIPLAVILITLFPSLQKPQVRVESQENAVVAYAACCREAGTTWSVSLDKNGIVNVTSEYVSDSSSPCAVIGIGGYDVFTFTAAGEGKATATLKYSGKKKTAEEKITLYSHNGKVTTTDQTDVPVTPVSITAQSTGKVYADSAVSNSNFKVFVNYSDNTKKEIKDFTIEPGYSPLTGRTYTVSATVDGKKLSTDVFLEYIKFTDVKAVAKGVITIGKENTAKISSSDFTATVTYEDGSVRTGRSFEESATKTVDYLGTGYLDLIYGEAGLRKFVTGKIEIVSGTEFVSIKAEPRKESYVPGYTFTKDDVICKAYRANDTEGVEVTNIEVREFTFTDDDAGKTRQTLVSFTDCGKYFGTFVSAKCFYAYDLTAFDVKMNTLIIHVGDRVTKDMLSIKTEWSDGVERDITDRVSISMVANDIPGKGACRVSFKHNGELYEKTLSYLVAEKDCPLEVEVDLCDFGHAVGDVINSEAIEVSAKLYARDNYYTTFNASDFNNIIFDEFNCTEKGKFSVDVSYPEADGTLTTKTLPFFVVANKRTTFSYAEDGRTITGITDGDGETLMLPDENDKGESISYDLNQLRSDYPEYKNVYFSGNGYEKFANTFKNPFDAAWLNRDCSLDVDNYDLPVLIANRLHYKNTVESDDGLFTAIDTPNGGAVIRYNGTENKDVTIPEKVGNVSITTIGAYAFYQRNARNLTVLENISVICSGAFSNFTVNTVDLGTIEHVNEKGLAGMHVNKLIANNLKELGKEAVTGSSIGELQLNAVEKVGESAFESSVIKSDITLPAATEIAEWAFKRISVSGAIILPSIKTIAPNAFTYSNLKYIKLPNTDRGTIADAKWGVPDAYVYYRNSNSGIQYDVDENGNAVVCEYIQTDAPVTKLVIPSEIDGHTVVGIGDGKNYGNFDGITEIVLPETATYIADRAFFPNTTIKKISGAGVTDIGAWIFPYNTAVLESIDFPSCKTIGEYAFYECEKLADVGSMKPQKVEYRAFYGTAIQKIDLSECVSLGEEAFFYCQKLTDIVSLTKCTSFGESVFTSSTKLSTKIIFNESIEKIPMYLFARTAITKVIFPEHLREIGSSAFNSCSSLSVFTTKNSTKTFELPSSIEKIGDAVFYGCYKLTGDLVIPEKVTAVERYTFYRCNFTSLTLHDGITFIGAEAFSRNTNMTGILTLPSKLEYLGDKAFDHDLKFENTSLYIPATLLTIGGDLWRPSSSETIQERARNSTHMFYNFASQTFKEYIVDENNPNYKSVDGVLFSKDGKRLVGFPCAKEVENGVYEVPEGVVEFDDMCFSRAGIGGGNLSVLVLPDTFTVADNLGHKNCVSYSLISYNTLSASLYYTGVKELRVKDSNPNFTCVDGVLYSKDMTTLVCVPPRYEGKLVIPEGVTRAVKGAIGGSNVDSDATMVSALKGRVTEISIPSTLTDIYKQVRNMGINSSGATITVDERNSVYYVKDGLLELK